MGSINDLNQAVNLINEGLNATPHNYLQRNTLLSSLGSLYGNRFRRMGSLGDLHQAASLMNEALDAMPSGYHARSDILAGLASLHHMISTRTNSLDDLDQTISFLNEAANATPHDHPNRASSLFHLGRMIGMRAAITESQDDARRMLELIYWELALCDCLSPPTYPISLYRRGNHDNAKTLGHIVPATARSYISPSYPEPSNFGPH